MEEIDPVLQKRQDNAKRFDGLALLQPEDGISVDRWTLEMVRGLAGPGRAVS